MSTAVFCHGCGTRRDALIVNDELACTSCSGAFVEILGAEAEAVGPAPAPMPALFVGGMAMPRIYIHRAAGLDDTMMMQVMSGLFQQPQQQAPLDPTQDAAQQPPQAQQQQQQNGQPPQQEQPMAPQSLAAMLRVITTQVMQEAAALQAQPNDPPAPDTAPEAAGAAGAAVGEGAAGEGAAPVPNAPVPLPPHLSPLDRVSGFLGSLRVARLGAEGLEPVGPLPQGVRLGHTTPTAANRIAQLLGQILRNDAGLGFGLGVAPAAPSLSAEELGRLQHIDVVEENKAALGDCYITQEAFEEGEVCVELPCSHRFKEPMIARWLQGHNTCPVCRAVVKAPAAPTPLGAGAGAAPASSSASALALASAAGAGAAAGAASGPAEQRRPGEDAEEEDEDEVEREYEVIAQPPLLYDDGSDDGEGQGRALVPPHGHAAPAHGPADEAALTGDVDVAEPAAPLALPLPLLLPLPPSQLGLSHPFLAPHPPLHVHAPPLALFVSMDQSP